MLWKMLRRAGWTFCLCWHGIHRRQGWWHGSRLVKQSLCKTRSGFGLRVGEGWRWPERAAILCVFQENLLGSVSLMDSHHSPVAGLRVCVCECVCVYHSSDLLFQKINDMPQDESTDIYTNDVNDILAPSISFVCCSWFMLHSSVRKHKWKVLSKTS